MTKEFKNTKKLRDAFPDIDESEMDELRKLELKCEDSHTERCKLLKKVIDLMHEANGKLSEQEL